MFPFLKIEHLLLHAKTWKQIELFYYSTQHHLVNKTIRKQVETKGIQLYSTSFLQYLFYKVTVIKPHKIKQYGSDGIKIHIFSLEDIQLTKTME